MGDIDEGIMTERKCPVCEEKGTLSEIPKSWGVLYVCSRCEKELYCTW